MIQKKSLSETCAQIRKERIGNVKSLFVESISTGKLIKKELLTLELCNGFSVSKRTAQEYIEIALHALNYPKVFSEEKEAGQAELKT